VVLEVHLAQVVQVPLRIQEKMAELVVLAVLGHLPL
jgi:hypothetical protein